MADTSLFSRLRRLFSTNVIVRNVGGKKLKVSDTSRTQSINSKNNLVDRYQKIFTGAGLKVSVTSFPVCRPTPSREISSLMVLCFETLLAIINLFFQLVN